MASHFHSTIIKYLSKQEFHAWWDRITTSFYNQLFESKIHMYLFLESSNARNYLVLHKVSWNIHRYRHKSENYTLFYGNPRESLCKFNKFESINLRAIVTGYCPGEHGVLIYCTAAWILYIVLKYLCIFRAITVVLTVNSRIFCLTTSSLLYVQYWREQACALFLQHCYLKSPNFIFSFWNYNIIQ